MAKTISECEIENVRAVLDEGHPWLRFDLDGKDTWIDYSQPLLPLGGVALYNWWEDPRAEWIVPADEKNGRPEPFIMPGATGDVRIFRLAAWFRGQVDAGRFQERRVDQAEVENIIRSEGALI